MLPVLVHHTDRDTSKEPEVRELKVTPDIYVDADYAADTDSRRSVTGHLFMLAGAPYSWQSRQQASVALSTIESEYMEACAAA